MRLELLPREVERQIVRAWPAEFVAQVEDDPVSVIAALQSLNREALRRVEELEAVLPALREFIGYGIAFQDQAFVDRFLRLCDASRAALAAQDEGGGE